jgi:hypothetical protein
MKHIATGTLLAGAVIGFSATAAVAGAPGARPGDTTAVQVQPGPVEHQPALKPRCGLMGTFSNIYGATITMTTGRKGTYTASYCGAPWKVKRTARSRTGFTVAMTYTGTNGCTNFTETLTWENACANAAGHFTDPNGTTGPDTWTRTGPDHRVVK